MRIGAQLLTRRCSIIVHCYQKSMNRQVAGLRHDWHDIVLFLNRVLA
jgi:hypothetical protein